MANDLREPDAIREALYELAGREFTDTLYAKVAEVETAAAELDKAAAEHPELGHLLHHAFPLLRGTHPLMSTEFIYRAHVRELIARVIAGQDTRPGTMAEVAIVCSVTSLEAPFHGAGAGLYGRAFTAVYDGEHSPWEGGELEWYERMHGEEIDRLERDVRRHAAQAWRTLPKVIECEGMHAGEAVTCEANAQAAAVRKAARARKAAS